VQRFFLKTKAFSHSVSLLTQFKSRFFCGLSFHYQCQYHLASVQPVNLRFERDSVVSKFILYMTPFSTKNGTVYMRFGHSFTQKWRFGGLEIQAFQNLIRSVFENKKKVCVNYKTTNL